MRNNQKNCVLTVFIAVIIFLVSALPSYSRTLKFIQLSDIHYSVKRADTPYKMLSNTKALTEDAVSQINNEKKIKFVIVTGDGIDRPNTESFEQLTEILNTLKSPWYYSIGNHDTTATGSFTKQKLFEELKKNNKNFEFDSTYYTFKPKAGFRVIVLDGARETYHHTSSGTISQEQLCWLDNILEQSKRDTVLIFLHFPLLPPYECKGHQITNADEFQAVLDKYKMPIAIFTGHFHAAKIRTRDNILHVSSPALATFPNAFRIIKIKNTRKKVIYNINLRERNLKDIQKKARIITLGGRLYYGTPHDRNAVIKMDKKR